jgi:hypothetical protein
LCVVRGRHAGEGFFHRVCRLAEADECQLVQDEHHAAIACKHPAICGLRAHFEYVFDERAQSSAEALEELRLFIDQRDVVEVAKFVKQLQTLVDYLMEQLTNFLFFLAWFPVC